MTKQVTLSYIPCERTLTTGDDMDENMTHTHARRSYGAASGRDTVSDPPP